jgi:ELWxxDGT repeat protein
MKKSLLIASLLISISSFSQLRLVSDVKPGVASSNPILKGIFNAKLFLSANYSSFNTNFYLSDGITTKGFYSVIGSALETPFVSPTVPYIVYNNQIVMFNAYSVPLPNFSYLSKCDGISLSLGFAYTNTVYQETNFLGIANSVQLGDAVILNGNIVFAPKVTTTFGAGGDELLTANDTSGASILKDIYPGINVSSPREMTVLGTNVFFSANDGINGRELWKTDGTPAGTTLYLNLNTGAANSNPAEINVLGTSLTFVATHPTLGRELFKSNGVGSLTLLKDINTSGDSNPTNCTVIGGLLYFSADKGTTGQELWVSGGTTLSTTAIKDINPTGDSNPSKFTQFGSTVFFIANDGTNGVELWKTDGTALGTVLVKNINPSGDSNPDYLTVYNGKLYFTADNGTNGTELWVSDGTLAGTTMIEINPTATSNISHLLVLDNELFFAADAGTVGKELYAYMDPVLATNDFKLNDKLINLYPNPSNFFFELSGNVTIQKVEIYSMLGQFVKTFNKQNQYGISDLSKGNYIVKINAVEGISSKTLIVQ